MKFVKDVMIDYLSCGCMIWLSDRANISVNDKCPRCGQHDVDVIGRERRFIDVA
jgi:hypothetical protein